MSSLHFGTGLVESTTVSASQDEDVRHVVILWSPQCWGLYRLFEGKQEHPLTHFMETLVVLHTLLDAFEHIVPLQLIARSHFLSDSKKSELPVQDNSTIAQYVERVLPFNRFDDLHQLLS